MNILILTPDAVGSTLLQRLITIYCQFQDFLDTYINIHELTNGISKFYSHDFNREILSRDSNLEYSQSLQEIIKILTNADHKIIARIAQYHLLRRQDSQADLAQFYKFCNENFFIIATRRSNVFEYALSQYINRISKHLNVYSPDEKINVFADLYQSPVNVDPIALKHILKQYKNYVDWSEEFFNVASYFDYTNDIANIEQYILNLPVFCNKSAQKTWEKIFGLDFKKWNLCHLLTGDLDNIPNLDALDDKTNTSKSNALLEHYYKKIIKHYNDVADESWPKITNIQDYANLPIDILTECHEVHKLSDLNSYERNLSLIHQLSNEDQFFLKKYQTAYLDGINSIEKMVQLGVLPGHLPIKKQTLIGKSRLIKNFEQCLEVYNDWATINQDLCHPMSLDNVQSIMEEEKTQWRSSLKKELSAESTDHMIGYKI